MHLECANKCITCGAYLTDEESLNNKFRCNSCNTSNAPKIDVVRRSHIEEYKKCPHQFYLNIVKGVPYENNAYALQGIILHDMFEKYSTNRELDKDGMEEEFRQRYLEEVGETNISFRDKPELQQELLEKGYRAIQGFKEYELTHLPAWEHEKTIQFSVGDNFPLVQITMDRIEKLPNGKMRWVDYKCGKTFAGKKLNTDLQVPLYCLACKSEYGELPVEFEFLFLSEGKTRLFTLQGDNRYVCYVGKRMYEVRLTEAIREVKDVFGKIKKQLYSPNQNVSEWYCKNLCPYFRNGACEGKEKQMWKGVN